MLGIDSDYPADSIFYKKQFNIVPKKFQFIVKWSNLVPKKELSVNKNQFNAVKTHFIARNRLQFSCHPIIKKM